MFNRRKTLIFLFCLVLVAFGFGLYRLMALRFESGNIFPAYSSLRSDPLGSKVLYESFGRLPDIVVQRNFQKLKKLKDAPPTTIFLLGLSPFALEHSLAKQLDELAQVGHRVILTMAPVQGKACDCPEQLDEENGTADDETEETETEPDASKQRDQTPEPSILERWGFQFDYAELFTGEDRSYPSAVLVSESHQGKLPRQITQHSELYFTEPDESWHVLYRFDDYPVIMARARGEGSLVLVSDSYLVSNEAMRQERHPVFLSWLAGNHGQLVFDETHLGLSKQLGVMVLVRQYRLTGFIGALLVLAFLYLWQRSVVFIPLGRDSDPDEREETSAMDYHAGLVNLLKRNVKESDLLSTCYHEWLKSMPVVGHKIPEQTARIRAEVEAAQALPPRERKVLGCYKKIAGILAERKHLWK